jgi:hypothetical protein
MFFCIVMQVATFIPISGTLVGKEKEEKVW